jgi:hypothetical protein
VRKARLKILKQKLNKIISEPTKQQWKVFKNNYKKGFVP